VYVLLHAPGSSVPTNLLASISKKIPNIRMFSDSYLALADLCAAAKRGSATLVLVEPSTIADAAELIEVLRLHAPKVAIWWYSKQETEKLRRLEATERTPWFTTVPVLSTPERRAGDAGGAAVPGIAVPGIAVPGIKGPRLASTVGPETPRLKPGGAPAFRPAAKGSRPANESPRVVVRPGAGIGARRLRLVGEEAENRPAAAGSTAKPLGLSASASGDVGAKTSIAPEHAEEAGPRIPLLSEEELRMLLADDEPGTTNGSGQERSGH